MSPPTTMCTACGAVWRAPGAAHCTSCHEQFASVTAFDRHRGARGEHGHCVPPAEAGLVRRGDGAWSGEAMPAEVIELRAVTRTRLAHAQDHASVRAAL
jgi:hypothetical protein